MYGSEERGSSNRYMPNAVNVRRFEKSLDGINGGLVSPTGSLSPTHTTMRHSLFWSIIVLLLATSSVHGSPTQLEFSSLYFDLQVRHDSDFTHSLQPLSTFQGPSRYSRRSYRKHPTGICMVGN